MATIEIPAHLLQPGDIVVDSPSVQVDHITVYPLLPGAAERFVDIFYTGLSYPVYVSASTIFDVVETDTTTCAMFREAGSCIHSDHTK